MIFSIKNSISNKILVPVVGLLLVSALSSYAYMSYAVRKNTVDSIAINSEESIKKFKLLRGYYSKNVIKKVIRYSDLKPSINHASEEKTIPLPATMIHDPDRAV